MSILQKSKRDWKGKIKMSIKNLLFLNLICSSIRCFGVVGTSVIAIIAFVVSTIKKIGNREKSTNCT